MLPLEAFPTQVTENIRYGDTDRQGHVNNAVYATYFESGRVDLLHDSLPLLEAMRVPLVGWITLGLLLYALIAKGPIPFRLPGVQSKRCGTSTSSTSIC